MSALMVEGRNDVVEVSWAEAAATLNMLARMIGNVPDAGWTPSLVEAVDALDDEAPGCSRMKAFLREQEGGGLDALVELLAVDWTLAFRGMSPKDGPRPPYAGAWISHDGVGVQAMCAINGWYLKDGFVPVGGRSNRGDYLGVELDYVAAMIAKYQDEPSEEYGRRIVQFLDEYVLSWLGDYRGQVEERCRTPFWKGYLELAHCVIEDVRNGLE